MNGVRRAGKITRSGTSPVKELLLVVRAIEGIMGAAEKVCMSTLSVCQFV